MRSFSDSVKLLRLGTDLEETCSEIRLISLSLAECFLSMQVCFLKNIKEMLEINLCVTPHTSLKEETTWLCVYSVHCLLK